MYHKQQPLRFHCTGCGKCCSGGSDHYVAMSKNEAERIRRHLGITDSWFRRRYVEHLTRNTFTARMPEGRCTFLDKKGQCKIYHLRPVQCRTYPYWPEILQNKQTWNNEAKHCEGINAGAIVPIKNIKQKLAQQLRSEQDEL